MFVRVYTAPEIKNALDCYSRFKSFRKAAKRTNISKTTIHRWWHSFHTCFMRTKIQKRKKVKRNKMKYPKLVEFIKQLFDTVKLEYHTLSSIQNAYRVVHYKKPSTSWIAKVLKQSKISRRRFPTTIMVSSNFSKFKDQFDNFKNTLDGLQNNEIVCVDETGFCSVGNTCYSYFPKGKQPQISFTKRREHKSCIMGISSNGVIAPYLQKESFNSVLFANYLRDYLLPNIPKTTKAILMDNVAFHKTKVVRDVLQSKGIIPLFIAPYSPRCNPIEEVFSVLKRRFRSLHNGANFNESINMSIEHIKSYKSMECYYNHTRQYVNT